MAVTNDRSPSSIPRQARLGDLGRRPRRRLQPLGAQKRSDDATSSPHHLTSSHLIVSSSHHLITSSPHHLIVSVSSSHHLITSSTLSPHPQVPDWVHTISSSVDRMRAVWGVLKAPGALSLSLRCQTRAARRFSTRVSTSAPRRPRQVYSIYRCIVWRYCMFDLGPAAAQAHFAATCARLRTETCAETACMDGTHMLTRPGGVQVRKTAKLAQKLGQLKLS
jgi:hypothetical protein